VTVDDLTILREVGREFEHEPPATLVRQRQRLLDMAGTGGHRRWSLMERGWLTLALAGTVTAALLITPALLLASRQQPPERGPASGERSAAGPTGPLNLLLVGHDGDRTGGTTGGSHGRSDTMMLLHLPADRRGATLLSIPRDTVVKAADCPGNAPTALVGAEAVGAAYQRGGLPCAVRSVETLTSLRVDYGIAVGFAGFAGMVDALGGVRMRIPQAVHDRKAHLDLPAGQQLLNGRQALGYVRARVSLGDGSDLSRIARQQQFVRALAARARERLSDPRRLVAFLRAAGEATTVLPSDSRNELFALVRTLMKASDGSLRTITLPVRILPSQPNQLAVDRAAAERVLAGFRGR
jgi:LCP family protein required for cell wall assembly